MFINPDHVQVIFVLFDPFFDMKIKFSFFLLLLALKLLGQNTLDSLVNQLKQHDYVSTQKILLNSNKPVVKNAFSYLLDYKQLGYGTFELYGEEGLSNR